MLNFQKDYNKDTLIPNPMGTTEPAGTESVEGQVMAEDMYAEGWVLTDPNDPNPANTTALPEAPPAATATAIPQQQQATMGNQVGLNALPANKFLLIWQVLPWPLYT